MGASRVNRCQGKALCPQGQDTRTMQADVPLMLDVLTRNDPNGHQGLN
ncbi:MAG: hypothetical protein Q6J18_07555 [Gloeomargarita sp. DG02_3_bins_56]